ncbi:MAG TPA: protease complex subunit PrcB family protein [Pyrinomonadaceae bacterium]|jgi:hypothetical protein
MASVLLLSLALNGAGAAGCETKRDKNQAAQDVKTAGNNNVPAPAAATPTPEPATNGAASDGLKVLMEGSQSGVADAFVAVARDAETYGALRETLGRLPELSADSFRTSVVVAAFLGRRTTGGYSVQITSGEVGSIRLSESQPPKGAIVTQALTTPFKVVSVPVGDKQPLSLEMEGGWKSMTRPFNVTGGTFTVTGGFAGTTEDFRLEGGIGIMREGKLATLAFDLKAASGTKTRALKDVATGVVQPDGSLMITHMAAGPLVSLPPGALRADGKLIDGESKLTLAFESLPSNVDDGYQGKGRLEATASAPPPQKRKPFSEDHPV